MENKTFEEKLKLLEEMVAKLEKDDLGLSESIELFEKSQKLAKELKLELDESLSKISYIVENDTILPFNDENDTKTDI